MRRFLSNYFDLLLQLLITLVIFALFTEPNFVSTYEIGDHVYVFFREVAIEYINCGKASFPYNFLGRIVARMFYVIKSPSYMGLHVTAMCICLSVCLSVHLFVYLLGRHQQIAYGRHVGKCWEML